MNVAANSSTSWRNLNNMRALAKMVFKRDKQIITTSQESRDLV